MSRAEDLARLREETQAGQHERMEFVTNLTRTVAELIRANQAANKERQHNLQETLMANEGSRKQGAERLHKACTEFIANLTRTVAELRKANQAENAAAGAAWCGARATGAVSARRGGKKWFGPAEKTE